MFSLRASLSSLPLWIISTCKNQEIAGLVGRSYELDEEIETRLRECQETLESHQNLEAEVSEVKAQLETMKKEREEIRLVSIQDSESYELRLDNCARKAAVDEERLARQSCDLAEKNDNIKTGMLSSSEGRAFEENCYQALRLDN